MATLIKQAYILDPTAGSVIGADGTADVLIEAGKIAAIAPLLTEHAAEPLHDVTLIDGRGQFLGPGLIDLYSQSGEPGYESRETYDSLRLAAAAGGFTRVGLLPNTQPATDSLSAVAAIQTANRAGDRTARKAHLMPWAAITLGTKGQHLTELAELARAGALGFTDGQPITHGVILRRLLEYAQPLQKPIALWPCDLALAGNGVARESLHALQLGLQGVSAIAETTALSTLLECVIEIPALVHIMRVSTARSVHLIRQAKDQGLPISASVPWHHLIFDTHDLHQYDPNLRHEPPLGTPQDRQALIEGVATGVIDAIAIDHSPYTYEEKTVAFDNAPPGAIGLELALSVLWQTFVTSGKWSPMQLWQSLSQRPAQCLGLTPPSLQVNHPAEITLFDPKREWSATDETLHSLARNTPWLNQRLQGKVVDTIIPGHQYD
ncbi:MAG: dihydroorotase [Phormidesmis sp. RL_2_1]|nr:dihydroorotase [Phormidesmis sp. RL_2_1]